MKELGDGGHDLNYLNSDMVPATLTLISCNGVLSAALIEASTQCGWPVGSFFSVCTVNALKGKYGVFFNA